MTLASREVPVMVGLRLFLPDIWTNDPERMKRARVPKDRQVALTKPEIAIEEIDRVIASGSLFCCVLADAGYGSSIAFRQALSERGLLRAVGLSRRQNVYPADVDLIFPVATSGRRRQYHIPDQPPVSATVPCHTIYASLLQEGCRLIPIVTEFGDAAVSLLAFLREGAPENFEATGLLGGDFLRHHAMFVDFDGKRMFVRSDQRQQD